MAEATEMAQWIKVLAAKLLTEGQFWIHMVEGENHLWAPNVCGTIQMHFYTNVNTH